MLSLPLSWRQWLRRTFAPARRERTRNRPCFDQLEARLNPAPTLGFAIGIGGTGADDAESIAVDSTGNTYLAGKFFGTVDFDPGPATVNLTSAGAGDIYLAKYNPAGALVWAERIGSTGDDWGEDLTVDSTGNIFVSANYSSTPIDVDPGTGTTTLSTGMAFVAKFTNAGALVWATACSGFPDRIAVDATGNVYAVGEFFSSGTFGPFTLTNGGQGPYVLKFDPSGNYLWAKGLATSQGSGFDVAVDSSGNVFATGRFSGTMDADPGTGTTNITSAGGSDVFLLKLDSSGNFGWVKQFGGTGADNAWGIALDATNNILVGGTFASTADFDPGTGTTNLTSAGGDDGFLAKFDSSGNFLYVRQLGGSGDDVVKNVTVDAAGNIHLGGNFRATADFDPGTATFNLTSAGSDDLYVATLNSAGNFVWAGQMGGTGQEFMYQLVTNGTGSFFATGTFAGTADFDPASGTSNVTSNGSTDTFLVTLLEAPVIAGVTITQTAGSTDVAEGGATDTYTVVLTSAPAPSANVVITLQPGTQLGTTPTTLTFNSGNWSTPQTVTVSAIDDAAVEGVHTGIINHTAASTDAAYNGITIASVTANITDNDTGPPAGVTVTQSGGSTSVAEGGATDTYAVVLDSPPTADVIINLSGGSQLTTAPTSLTFTTSNWNVPQTLVVTAIDDPVVENAHTGVVTHTAASTDARYAGIAIANLNVNITDNDLDAGALIIYGTERGDRITATFATSLIQVAVNGRVTFYPNTYPSVLVLAGNGINRIQIVNPSVPVTIVGGGQKDDVFLDGQAGANAFGIGITSIDVNAQSIFLTNIDNVILSGKTGADMFTVQAVPAYTVTIQAGAGKDTLIAADQANDWRITGSDTGTLDGTIAFSFVENLTGGADDDRFWFAAGRFVSGTIDGAGGNNTLDFSAHKTQLTVNLQPTIPTINRTHLFQNVAAIYAGSASDKLIGPDQSSTWNITTNNAGDVNGLVFTGFENLTGGAMDDTFSFSDRQSIKGKLDGGGGIDTLNLSAYSTFVVINLQTKVSTTSAGVRSFASFESFVGGASADTLIAPNRANAWDLTGVGTGTVAGTAFADFENLTGGSAVDTFNFADTADWAGILNGGTGNDILNASAGWTYTTTGANMGTLNGRSFKSIEVRR